MIFGMLHILYYDDLFLNFCPYMVRDCLYLDNCWPKKSKKRVFGFDPTFYFRLNGRFFIPPSIRVFYVCTLPRNSIFEKKSNTSACRHFWSLSISLFWANFGCFWRHDFGPVWFSPEIDQIIIPLSFVLFWVCILPRNSIFEKKSNTSAGRHFWSLSISTFWLFWAKKLYVLAH